MNHYANKTTEEIRALEERRATAGLNAEAQADRDEAARRRMARGFKIAPDGSVTTADTIEDWSGYYSN